MGNIPDQVQYGGGNYQNNNFNGGLNAALNS